MRLHPVLLLALAAAVGLGVLALRHGAPSSSLRDADRRAELNAAARSLLPGSFRELASGDGQCVMFAEYPSCLTLVFARQGEARARAVADVRRTAGAAGWERTDTEDFASATTLHFHRGGLTAWVSIGDDAPTACGGPAVDDCPARADELQVSYS